MQIIIGKKKENVTVEPTDIQRIIREYLYHLYANKTDKLRWNVQILWKTWTIKDQEEIDNLTSPTSIKGIELILKTQKTPDPLVNSSKYVRKKYHQVYTSSSRI